MRQALEATNNSTVVAYSDANEIIGFHFNSRETICHGISQGTHYRSRHVTNVDSITELIQITSKKQSHKRSNFTIVLFQEKMRIILAPDIPKSKN